ncbi:hypothetical protein HYH02_010065 [Chlamydomonas schloesseri]|uniref:Uncharacterized protein n=1 Tax=Chlamydomonas schloesseri TaxID=2026947 RepID=A0A835W9D0_9CHLO|nr:hypothetical protein HYH02_010065 [Chlamydomonas schloesseri]|eukprot:KAG2441221.1 hypothetical protein HYH02_010065 [Chlamydomonas schloesseri]
MRSLSMKCSASAPAFAIHRRSLGPSACVGSGAGNSGMPPPRARNRTGAADEPDPEDKDPMVKAAKIQAAGAIAQGTLIGGLIGGSMFFGFYVLANAVRGVPGGLLESLRNILLEHGLTIAGGLVTVLAYANAAPMVAAASGVVAVGASPLGRQMLKSGLRRQPAAR